MATLSKLDKLTYSIGIIDKVTGPVNKVMAKINQLSQQTAAAQDQMMRGAATAVGGGYALAKSLAPAIDHVAALGEVQSLGVADEALQKLSKTSYEFGFQFGGNSAEFVRSAYDIQSAINGLNGFELSEFTKTSNILAVATKADAATITSYMGTMYGIFEKTANKMGKANWVNQIAGQTATAVQLYKTTGAEMQAAFSNLGATATNIGLSSAQQFALVGELQLVAKSGSVAGTQAASLLQGIGKAQDALGIKLTADNGDMLAIDVVLGRINNRLSSLGSVARGDVLTQIFGKQGAKAVDVLSTKVDKLKDGITVFENVQDNSKALEMANIIASPWDRLGGSFNAAATAMGNRLLPVVEPFVEILAAGFAGIVSLTERFPFLSSVIATLVVVIVALITVHGIIIFTMGLYKMALVSSAALTGSLTVLTKLWQGALIALRVLGFLSLIATMGAAAIAMGTFKAVMLAGQAATWLFNAALWANPITWVVAGVIALIAAVGALIYYWDDLVAAFQNTAWGKVLMAVFDSVKAAFNGVIDSVKWVLEKLGLIDDTEAKIKTEATSTHENINRAQPKNLVMQNADQAFSRDYGQVVINKAAQVPGNTASTHYAAVSDITHSNRTQLNAGQTNNAINSALQNSQVIEQTNNARAQTNGLNNSAINSVVANAHTNAVTTAANDTAYSTSTAMSNATNPTLQNSITTNQTSNTHAQTSALNNSGVNSAVNDAVYSTSTAMSNAANPTFQNSIVTNQTDSTLTQISALNNSAINSAVNDAVYSTSTAMSNTTNPTLQNSIATNQTHNALTQTSALNNRAVNSVVANAPTNAVIMTANDAVYSTSAKTANINNSGINSAVNDAVYSTSTAMRNAANSTLQNSIATYQSHNAFTQISALNNSAVNSVVANAPTNAVTMAANDAVYSTSAKTANINNSAINSALQNSSVTHNSAGHIAQSTLFAPQSAPQNTVASTANNFTNAANSPVYSRKHVQVTRVNQGAAPLQPLPVVKTDQAITNLANASAYKVDQLSTEQQQQSNSYKAKVQKSAFLQNLTSNTHNSSSSSDSDNRKSVHIDSLTIKSDDLAQSFEQMMELAG
ncbi:phage tail tape measure protein [Pseudoalteromonas neustonica]|uniref:phage tail tape measure protein n=1 Tax=Pseudoalteromonas neustonica TaxID=1840331 RepID=UPI0007DB39DD|nr:phage tail tape measure protein [Pseudoalteromonas neustonica]